MIEVAEGLRLLELFNPEVKRPYSLAFSTSPSTYENWIEHLGGPDENALLLMALLRGKGTLIDVGANIGTISVPVAQTGSRVLAVEMLPSNCIKLWTSALANGLTNLEIVQAAASDHVGQLQYEGSEAWGHVVAGNKGATAVSLTLDALISHHPDLPEPLVLKVDVEGHEPAVFAGARATLAEKRPIVLFESIEIEGNPGHARASKQALVDLGYTLFLQRKGILSPKSPTDIQEGHVCDFLAVPNERASDLDSLGFEIRPLDDSERVAWNNEMARFPCEPHQRHAARVVLRWAREEPHLKPLLEETVATLKSIEHLAEMHDEIDRSTR